MALIVVGKHPLATRLMKGILTADHYNPSMCIHGRLDVLVINICTNHNLSLKQLSAKFAVLLALANASRTSEILSDYEQERWNRDFRLP